MRPASREATRKRIEETDSLSSLTPEFLISFPPRAIVRFIISELLSDGINGKKSKVRPIERNKFTPHFSFRQNSMDAHQYATKQCERMLLAFQNGFGSAQAARIELGTINLTGVEYSETLKENVPSKLARCTYYYYSSGISERGRLRNWLDRRCHRFRDCRGRLYKLGR